VSTLDVVILVPLIPAAPIFLTPWLPWERWVPWGKLPKAVLGPYLLYAAFAAWYFQLQWWFALGMALVGGVVSVIAALAIAKKPKP